MQSILKIEGDLTKELRDSTGGTVRTYQATRPLPQKTAIPESCVKKAKPRQAIRLVRTNSIPINANYSIRIHR